MIEFQNVTMKYPNGTKALNDFSLTIEDGEFVFIIGQSGAGKTTLSKLITREEKCSSGVIRVNNFNLSRLRDRDVPRLRRTLGVVFQDFRLIENKTVYENVAFAMKVIGASDRIVRKRVPYILNLVDLADKARRFPRELSGGEQQRAAIARALVNNPRVILADEPTGNVDPKMSLEIMELFRRINEQGTTVIVITHEHALVRYMKKRYVEISHGCVINDRVGG
ncbi:MAG: cell division ATP-binding protein FtsE [Clostridia bacterium]|nr:cell division ATP-binding protein FtsE [Clostridia bacterium]